MNSFGIIERRMFNDWGDVAGDSGANAHARQRMPTQHAPRQCQSIDLVAGDPRRPIGRSAIAISGHENFRRVTDLNDTTPDGSPGTCRGTWDVFNKAK